MSLDNQTTQIQTKEDAINFVHSSYQFGSKLGLENMQILMDKLDKPHKKLKFIHVAGTNGKGSTTAMLVHMLMAAGYKVGMYISPYLQSFNERIQINRKPIDDNALVEHTQKVCTAIQEMVQAGHPHPTEFEIVTAIGLSHFAHQAVDIVVLEVGLGGRLDATNIIDLPMAAVITPVAMDHMQYLGNTLAEIASEKAGIIKGGLVISALQEPEAFASISQKVAQKDARLIISDHTNARVQSMSQQGTAFEYKGLGVEINLLGAHQVQNACTAIDVVMALRETGVLEVTNAQLLVGLKQAQWAGRFEKIANNPDLIIDGAHNLHGMEAFIKAMNQYYGDVPKIAFFGMLHDKDVEGVLKLAAHYFEAIYTVIPDNPRALSHEALAEFLKNVGYKGRITPLEKIETIAKIVGDQPDKDHAFFCFGSLYYIGEVRKLFIANPEN